MRNFKQVFELTGINDVNSYACRTEIFELR